MTFSISKGILENKLSTAARFTLSKLSSVPSLQGGKLRIEKNKLIIITTNLNDFFYTETKIKSKKTGEVVVDIKKIVDFLKYLPAGDLEVVLKEKTLAIKSKNAHASFSLIPSKDFPSLPKEEGKEFTLKKRFLKKNLPLALFSVAKDESRPVLTGVNFLSKEEGLYIVSTDGFRLSLLKKKEKQEIPSVIISAPVLGEIMRLLQDEKEIKATYSKEEKVVSFKVGESVVFSRLIEGDFPPFEKVVPDEYTTQATINKDEFLRNIKLVSVFARDLSNIVVLKLEKGKISVRPRGRKEEGTLAEQEAKVEGEEQEISFNYKFILDFLNNAEADEVVFEMSEPNSPGVFKFEDREDYLHIIMPVRTEEEEKE